MERGALRPLKPKGAFSGGASGAGARLGAAATLGGPAPLQALMRRTPMHAAYDEAAAEDSWRRMLDFFAEHL